jgi:NAD(P)-dependent dehydrogenase (short-subunit alcohol dehydrogenase family)
MYSDHSDTPYADLVSLAGRRVVVTGAAAGLGQQIVRRLVEAGARVVIGDLDVSAAEALAAELNAGTDRETAIGAHVDVADHAGVEALADLAVDRFGGIDAWVNNAGVYPRGSVLDIDPDTWRRVMAINLDGTYYGSRAAARRMVDSDIHGVIVNIVSTSAFDAANGANGAHYVASKHGVAGLTKSIAVQLAPQGIRAIAIAPTLSRTPSVQLDYDAGFGDVLDAYGAGLPSGRLGVADDVARVVVFAVSDLASFVSGSTIAADGGDLAR